MALLCKTSKMRKQKHGITWEQMYSGKDERPDLECHGEDPRTWSGIWELGFQQHFEA